jgi:hypothetical protein
MRLMLLAASAALLLSACASAGQLGLNVAKNGILLKDGKPFLGIGVNYFDCFARTLVNPKDTSYREGFKVLADRHIPFVRFMAGGYWPKDNDLYFKDKQAFFKLMDGVVKSAEQNGIGLIPCFFLCYATVPDLVGEPMVEWGNPKSKTIAFMRQYVREWVTRYRKSPAIWGWEFGNEFQLTSDLNMSDHRPAIWPTLGTAKTRGERDDMTSDQSHYACKAFAEEVRKLDKDRIMLSGNAFPRAAAWHLRNERSWKQDSTEQFAETLLLDNEAMDTICVHMYPDALPRFDHTLTYAELLRVTIDIAAKSGKPLFVEEFGTDEATGAAGRTEFAKMLSAIQNTHVPLAALWVYDFDGQKDTYNVSATNGRSYQLDAISKANRQIQEGPH